MFTPPAPTSFQVFTNFGLSSGLKDSYILREIIVLDAPVSVVNNKGYPWTVPRIYMPSGSFLVTLIDLITSSLATLLISNWPILLVQASLRPSETACSSLNACCYLAVGLLPYLVLCSLSLLDYLFYWDNLWQSVL